MNGVRVLAQRQPANTPLFETITNRNAKNTPVTCSSLLTSSLLRGAIVYPLTRLNFGKRWNISISLLVYWVFFFMMPQPLVGRVFALCCSHQLVSMRLFSPVCCCRRWCTTQLQLYHSFAIFFHDANHVFYIFRFVVVVAAAAAAAVLLRLRFVSRNWATTTSSIRTNKREQKMREKRKYDRTTSEPQTHPPSTSRRVDEIRFLCVFILFAVIVWMCAESDMWYATAT